MLRYKYAIYLLILLNLFGLAYGIVIVRHFPENITVGVPFTVNYTLVNPLNKTEDCILSQRVIGFTPITPGYEEYHYGPITDYYYNIPFSIGPYKSMNLNITLRVDTIYATGKIPLKITYVKCGNETYKSGPSQDFITINCNPDGKCDPDIGENPLSCPQDCPSYDVWLEKKLGANWKKELNQNKTGTIGPANITKKGNFTKEGAQSNASSGRSERPEMPIMILFEVLLVIFLLVVIGAIVAIFYIKHKSK